MRTDAQIDRQQVSCPNASTLGHGKHKSQFGDFVVWRDATYYASDVETKLNPQYNIYYGRVAGRVHYAPALDGDKGPVRDWLLVIALSSNLTFAMERWINPRDVTEVFEPKMAPLLAFLLSDDFMKLSPDTLRAWSASGFNTIQEYQEYVNRRLEDIESKGGLKS